MERELSLSNRQEEATYYLKDEVTTEILFGGGAGGGKSALGVLWLIDMCTNYAGTRWLMGRSKLKSLKETTLNTFFELSSKLGISDQINYNAQSGIIRFWNGSEIILKDLFHYPSDPNYDALGSLEITGAFIDECNQITYKAWQIVKSRVRYKLDEYGLVPKILGTCNPAKTWVYSKFYKPSKDGSIDLYRKFIQSLVTDNPFISKHYIENLKTLDKNSKERLLYGNWEYDDNPSALCSYDKILALFKNDHIERGEYFISADVARYGSDKSVIGLWDGLELFAVKEFAKSSTVEIQDFINNWREEYGIPNMHCIADDDGVGGGVVDNCDIVGFVNGSKAKNDENYQNLKTQCSYLLAEVINHFEMFISADIDQATKEYIIEEIEYLQSYKESEEGKKKILPKKEIKDRLGRSPDYLDMLVMRMYFELLPEDNGGYDAFA